MQTVESALRPALNIRQRDCLHCGNPFEFQSVIGCGPKFCSDECRSARTKALRGTRPLCNQPNCSNRSAYSDGICNACFTRRSRTGTLDRRVYKYRSLTSHGYVTLGAMQGHPLADESGRVYEHRKVLYDAIGEGPHSCHWCGTKVRWIKGFCTKGALVPDHLDGNKANNSPSNLVPACNPCNANRGSFIQWVMRHKDDPWLAELFDAARTRQ